jgi:hypothetical protein
MKEKNRIQYVSKKKLELGGIVYIEKDKTYFLEKNEFYFSNGIDSTHLIYEEETPEASHVFTINSELIDEYFMNMAEHRDIQINSILD